jgi:hypothetical protein
MFLHFNTVTDSGVNCSQPKKTTRSTMEQQFTGALLLVAAAVVFFAIVLQNGALESSGGGDTYDPSLPIVFLPIIAKNAESTILKYLYFIERLEYPKKNIQVYVRTDPGVDNTPTMLHDWAAERRSSYKNITFSQHSKSPNEAQKPSECDSKPHCWNRQRLADMIDAREDCLKAAFRSGAEYFFSVDTDVFLTNKLTLKSLLAANDHFGNEGTLEPQPIVSPMLHVSGNVIVSNFWSDVTPHGYYKRGHKYVDILSHRSSRKAEMVKVVHSAVLVHLENQVVQDHLSYATEPSELSWVQQDDVVKFGAIARFFNLNQVLLSDQFYGLMLDPMAESHTYADRHAAFDYIDREYLSLPETVGEKFLLKELIRDSQLFKDMPKHTPAYSVEDPWSDEQHRSTFSQLCDSCETRMNSLLTETLSIAHYKGIDIVKLHQSPQINLLRNLLSRTEIETIIEAALPRLKQSVVFDPDTGELVAADYRTAQSAWLKREEHPVIKLLYDRVEELTGLRAVMSEDFQVARYDGNGGEYKPHFDFGRWKFVDTWNETEGNRIATVLIYLSDQFEGGGTAFTRINTCVAALKGTGVLWYNLLPSGIGDLRTKHGGCPSYQIPGDNKDGGHVKWVANMWFAEGGNRHLYGNWGGAKPPSSKD